MEGYIKLHRKIAENNIFNQKRVYSKFEAWMDILLGCNFSEGEFLLGYELIKVMPGQHLTSKKKMYQKYGWGKEKLNNFLRLLQDQKMLSVKTVGKSSDKATLIEVLNWGKYQYDQPSNQPSSHTSTGNNIIINNNIIYIELDEKHLLGYKNNKIMLKLIDILRGCKIEQKINTKKAIGVYDYIIEKSKEYKLIRMEGDKWTTIDLELMLDKFRIYYEDKPIKNIKSVYFNWLSRNIGKR